MIDDSALPATLTAVHLLLAVLRRHRAGAAAATSPFVLPSFIFVFTPWLWPSPVALAGGAALHILWFAVSERLAPPRPLPAVRAATAPAVPASPPAPRPPAFVTTSVLAVIDETPEIKTFRLARPDGFAFVPGQFIAVRVQIDGRPHVRCYSLTSSPDVPGYLEIAVRRQGLVSGMLHAVLRPGALVHVGRPAGAFVYPAKDDRPLALIAGGVGITPLLCMLRHAVSADPARPVTLLYSARREEDIAFVAELQLLAARHPQVRIALTLTKADRATRYRTGRIDVAMIRQHLPAPAQTIFCLCGPGAMLEDARALLASLGVPAGQVHFEAFETAAAAAVLNASVAEAAPRLAPSTGNYRVTFTSTQRVGTSSSQQTLLETAEAAGVAIVSSCRSGVCQSCRTRLSGGLVDCRSDMLAADDREAGFILPCVSWAQSDCALEA
jgi:ferredoxin-NADP reductase